MPRSAFERLPPVRRNSTDVMPEPVALAENVVVPEMVAPFDGTTTFVDRFATVIEIPTLVLLFAPATTRDVSV